MSAPHRPHVFRLDEQPGPAGRRLLRQVAGAGRELIVISDFGGQELPRLVTDPRIDRDPGSSGTVWMLYSAEGRFHFHARAVDRLQQRPELYRPLHRRFALRTVDRIAARLLLWLLRLPGGPRLLRNWHSRRR